MPGPKRTKDQREQDIVLVAEWYLKGKLQQEIADHLGSIRDYTLTQQQISGDLRTIRNRWQASALRDFDELKAQELAKVDRLEITYWESWDRSLGPKETRTAAQIRGVNSTDQDKVVTQQQTGDPRFLVGVQWCINKRCDIFGLDAPTKVAPTDPSGRKAYVLTESERMERLTTLLGHALAGLEEEPNEAISPPDDA